MFGDSVFDSLPQLQTFALPSIVSAEGDVLLSTACYKDISGPYVELIYLYDI